MGRNSHREALWFLLVVVLYLSSQTGQAARAQGADAPIPTCHSGLEGLSLYISPTLAQDRVLIMYAGVKEGVTTRWGLFKSSDIGLTWHDTPLPNDPRYWHDVVFSPNYAQDQTLYITFDFGLQRLERSTDGGQTWLRRTPPRIPGYETLALRDADTLFLSFGNGQPGHYNEQGLFHSTDGGQTWARLYGGGVSTVAVSPAYDQDHTILIGDADYHWDGGVFRSTDAGRTWAPSRDGMEWGGDGAIHQIEFSPDYAQDRTVFSVNRWGLYKSTSAAAQWARIDASIDFEVPFTLVQSLVLSSRYSSDQTLWAAVTLPESATGAARSTDGGATWQLLPAVMRPLTARELCGTDGVCRVVLFGEHYETGQFYKSFDLGQTWQCLEDSAPPPTPVEVPEPATWLLLGSGLAGLAAWRWHDPRRSAERAISPEDTRRLFGGMSVGSGLRLPERARH